MIGQLNLLDAIHTWKLGLSLELNLCAREWVVANI